MIVYCRLRVCIKQNQNYRLQRLLGLQAKRTRLQPCCGPLGIRRAKGQNFLLYGICQLVGMFPNKMCNIIDMTKFKINKIE